MKLISAMSFACLVLLAACKQAPKSDEATVTNSKEETKAVGGETFVVDKTASKVEWVGTKVSGYHTGTVAIKSGELTVKENQLTSGKFVLDMTSIKAVGPEKVPADASLKLTHHLLSPDFFDTEKFPEATFVITDVKPFSGTTTAEADDPRQEKLNSYKVANPTHTVSGNLTVKGIEKNISFPAAISVNGNTVEAHAKFNIDRKQWKIEYTGKPDDLIRDEVNLGISLVAHK